MKCAFRVFLKRENAAIEANAKHTNRRSLPSSNRG